MGLGDLWNPNLHPRGWHGRFVKKFKLAGWLDSALKNFNPRQFQSQGQANQFAFNQPKKIGKDLLATRRIKIDFDEAADHLRNGDIDDTTKKFMEAIDPHFEPAPRGGLILSRTFGPEALGLTPQQLNEDDPNGITGMMGNTLQDKMYSPTHLGVNTSHGPGKITMSIATPEGTPVAYSGTNPNDPGVYLNRDQKLLVTRVFPDGQGGWYMSAVAEPPGATSGSPVAAVQGRKGAGLNEVQREARIGGPSVFKQAAPPPSGDSTGHQLNIPGQTVEPGPPQTPEKAAAAAPARQARKAAYQQARQAEQQAGGIPQGATPPPQAPQPVQPTPTPASGVGERTEPVHGPIGGTPTEGKSASEIAATPPAPSPTPAPTGLQEGPPPAATFRQAFHDAGLEYPSSGAQRSEVNKALLPVMNGKGHPQDSLRMLESDIKHNERHVQDLQPDSPQARDMHDNIDRQRKIADFMAQHFNLPREGKAIPEAAHAPEAPKAPEKTFFKTIKELTPEERKHYDSLDQLGRSRYLSRRRAGQGHEAALAGAKGTGKAAPAKVAKAAPEPRKGLTTTGQESPNALPPLHTAKTEAPAAPVREKSPGTAEGKITTGRLQKGDKIVVAKQADGTYRPSTRKTGGTILTVGDVGNEPGSGNRRRSTRVVNGTDENGNPISVKGIPSHQTFWEHKEKAPRATKATKAAEAPAKAVPESAKPAAAKVAKAAPAPKAVSEVQTRADEAGLPKTVTALRAQAREQRIRGFSTMNKEQLQRALLGEEVSTGGGKLGPIAPEKLSGHIEAAATDQAARNLMEDHTVADLKALAKHNGVDLKGITRKDAIKDAIVKHIRGEGPGALRPEPPKESLDEQLKANRILKGGLGKEPDIKSIVDGVDGNDPNSLRSGRDELEKIANDTKTSDPIRSRIAQEAADTMGMRAQQISGVEEPPTPVKAAKVAKKAAAPKLSVHQERVRKQALADGATEEEARAAGEAAPVRAPAGTKAATAKAIKARKEAGLPESRQAQFERTGEFNPGPQQTVPKRAPKAAAKPKAGLPEGPGTAKPQGTRETAAPGDLLSPESTRKLRAAGLEPGVPGKGRPGAPEAAPVKKAAPSKELKPLANGQRRKSMTNVQEGDLVRGASGARGGLEIPQRVTKVEKAGNGIKITREDGSTLTGMPNTAVWLGDEKPKTGLPEAAPNKPTKSGIPAADEAKFKAAGVKPNKVVPQGSVKGERAQIPIDNQFRAHEFDAAYMKHVDRRGNISDHAIESEDQVAADISEGRITPEEGIRRIESEISFNNDEIQNLHRDIRSGNLEGRQLAQARHDLNALERDNASHEMLSRDLHKHFGKERVTVPEVKQSIAKNLGLNVGEMLKGTDAQSLKDLIHNDPNMAHLGEIKGNTGEEVFDNALKAMITHRMNEIAAEKEGNKVAKAAKAAPRKAAVSPPPAGKPEFEPGGAKHLDAKAIAGDLGVPDDTLKYTQGELNAGKTPGQAADTLRRHAQGIRDHAALVGLGRSDEELAKMDPEGLKTRNERLDQAAKMDELANRLKDTRRPTVRKAAPAKAVESIAEAKKATRSPAAKKALAEAETQVKEANTEIEKLRERITGRHQDAWNKSTTAKEAEAAGEAMRKEMTFAEMRDFFGKQGITGRSKDDLLKKAVERRFGSGGDISPEVAKSNAARQAVNTRMEESARLKRTGGAFSNVDEILANGGSERAVRHRVDNAGFDPATTAQVREAALAGDRPALDRIAQEHGLTRNTGAPGDIEPFEPGKHRGIEHGNETGLAQGLRKGDAIRVVQPGYQGIVEGRAFQAHPATVIKATPEEKAQMLDRLAQQKREGIAGLPAETRAAVLARSARQAQNPIAQKLAKKAAAGKAGITPPEPLPTNKAEEVAGNMERLNAAKAVKAAAPEVRAKPFTAQELHRLTPAETEEAVKSGRLTKARALQKLENDDRVLRDSLSTILGQDIFKEQDDSTIGKNLTRRQNLLKEVEATSQRLKLEGKTPGVKKAAKAAAPEVPVPTKAAKAAAPEAPRRLSTTKIAEQLRTVGSTEEANKLIDINLPRSKAQYRDLAEKVGVEVAPNDTMAKMHDAIVRHTATRRLEHAAYLRRAAPVTSTGAPERSKMEAEALAKSPPSPHAPPATALPTRGPIKSARVRFDENTSPATFGREDGNQPLKAPNGRWAADQGLIHMDSQIGELWKDLASDNRLPNSDLNKITVIGQDLGTGKISTKEAATELNGIRNGLTDGPVKDRFTEAVRGLDVKPTEYSVPDNTPKEVRDWLDKLNAIPAFHNKAPNSPRGQSPTPFEKAVALVRDVGEGKRNQETNMELRNIANNVHESGDGVYQARIDTDKIFFPANNSSEVRKWLRTPVTSEQAPEAPKAPAKATKAAKKAATPKVTQAELRNPVEKVGAAAPSATPSQIQATGLKAGEGIPTSPMLLARNKLGSGNAGTLTKLDTAVRIPARHSEIPGLLKDLQEQLQRAGVGPDDEPRKSLVAWFREHFKI